MLSITRDTFPDAGMAIASSIELLPVAQASCDKLYVRSLLACAASLKTVSCPMITYGDENYDWPEPDAEWSSFGHRQDLMLDSEKTAGSLPGHVPRGIFFHAGAYEGFTLLYGNDRFYAIIGYTRESLRSRLRGNANGCIHPDDLPEVRNAIAGALSRVSLRLLVMRVITGAGRTKYCQASCEFSPRRRARPL